MLKQTIEGVLACIDGNELEEAKRILKDLLKMIANGTGYSLKIILSEKESWMPDTLHIPTSKVIIERSSDGKEVIIDNITDIPFEKKFNFQ